jgi:hypothetical protein
MKHKKVFLLFSAIAFACVLVAFFLFWGGKGEKLVVSNIENKSSVNKETVPLESDTSNISDSPDDSQNIAEDGARAEITPEEKKTVVEVPENVEKKESNTSPDFKINNRLASWGYEKSSGRKIDTIILHSTYNATGGDEFDLDKIIGIYKFYGVAPHYIVARDAKVYRLVEDKNIAYHAGDSKMPDGRTGVNNFSIGIEIINSKTQGPTDAQYNSLKKLISYLKGRYEIKYILGHSDIAPGRKDDPWKFEWGKVK